MMVSEMMQHLANLAMEQATEMIAKKAEEFAASVMGEEAMKAFARAIRRTNEQLYPKGNSQ